MREEVWQDAHGNVTRYNLAFIYHEVCRVDNGRLLGYDNKHGVHHRHYRGVVQEFDFTTYDELEPVFRREVAEMRKEKP